jgi:hypothetical protein
VNFPNYPFPILMAFQKKFGGITIRKVEQRDEAWVEDTLRHRRLKIQESSSSQGLNHSILTGVSIGTNLAYLGVPWSQAITLTLEDARDVAHDTLLLHRDEERAVISLVKVPGQYKWMERTYYCVTCGTIWDLFGASAGLHSLAETHTREGASGDTNEEKDGQKRGGKRGGKRGSARGGQRGAKGDPIRPATRR